MRKPILNQTQPGGLVYDPFLGSGTTLAAAELTGRMCLGMELDPKFVDVIVMQWQKLTRQQAMLDGFSGHTFEQVKNDRAKAAQGAIDGEVVETRTEASG